MTFKEIETKYRASSIKVQEFKDLAESLAPIRHVQVSSYDHYFTKSENEFIRYRAGSRPELTIKVKVNDRNNFVRTEVNLPLDPNLLEPERLRIVKAFVEAQGFQHNFTIHKTCEIYFYANYNLVYYVVYDAELNEKERFIEIEMDEKHAWASEAEAWDELEKIEKQLSVLGLTPHKRVRKSLFEIFRKV